MQRSSALLGFIASVALISGASGQVVDKEPPLGQLREGQRVLVNDGSCPKGQIKEVIGGNHIKVGGTKTIERSRNCIPWR
jgi:hypothetical protein